MNFATCGCMLLMGLFCLHRGVSGERFLTMHTLLAAPPPPQRYHCRASFLAFSELKHPNASLALDSDEPALREIRGVRC